MDSLLHIALALALGFLVGLQRERSETEIAGVRTFPLITLLGLVSGQLVEPVGPWVPVAALVALAAMLWIGDWTKIRQGVLDPGLTTEIAALVMFSVGVVLSLGERVEAMVITGAVAVLLQGKEALHRFARRIGEAEFRALTRLVLLGLVILPILPDRSFGPYEVLNPFEIWLMVVLIVGISLAAYLVYQLLGGRAGLVAAGSFGGIISSTAATIGFARRGRGSAPRARSAALAIMIASTIVFGRVLLEIGVVAPSILLPVGLPLAVMMLAMVGITLGLFWIAAPEREESLYEEEAPSDLRTALVFGLLYAVVLLAVAAAKEHFGRSGLFFVAALSGLTDMDAITLSTAQLIQSGQLTADTGWRMILVGGMSNLVFKGGAVALLGGRKPLRWVAPVFGLSLAAGVLLLWLWPSP